jgi:RND family efflux transporter MFP subunit
MNFAVLLSRRTTLALSVSAALAVLAWGVSTQTQAQQAPAGAAAPAKAALTVQVVRPAAATMPVTLSASGNVAAWQEASIGAETQGLRLAELRADVGDRVAAGQVLARLADDTVKADLAQAEAALAEAKAQAAQAVADAQRARSLEGSGALSAQAIAQYVTAEQTAQARVASAQARVAAERLRLSFTEVRAPDAGVISARPATLGAVPGSGQELFRLIRQGRLEWRAEVPFADLTRLKAGQKVAVQAPGGQGVEGVVRQVAPTVDAASRNGLVYVDLPKAVDLRPGMFVRGEFRLAARQVNTLPASAVLLRDGFEVVMRVGDDQKVSQTKVQVVGRQAERVAIEGLPADAQVVERGAAFLSDGDSVKVVK